LKIKKAFISISSFTLISRVLGFIRDLLLASIIGAGVTTDAFLIAFKLPNFFRRIFAEGAFNAAFVPMFAEILQSNGKRSAIDFAEKILSLLLISTIIFVILAQIFMPFIIFLFAPGFSPEDGQYKLTVHLSRLTFPYLILISLVTLFSGILNSMGKFSAVAFTPIILNLTLIFSIFLTTLFNDNPGKIIAISVTIAGLLQLFWLLFPLNKLNVKLYLSFPNFTKKHREFLILFLPGVIGASVVQINLLTDIIFASLLPAGSISFLYFADRVNQLPVGIIGVALSTALLPILSKTILTRKDKEIFKLQNQAVEVALFFALPAMFAFIFFPNEIVKPLFERGKFSINDSLNTALALKAYAFGLPAYILIKVMTVQFFSRKDTRTPVIVAVSCVFLNIILNYYLIKYFQHVGLAIATAISSWLNIILLVSILYKKNWWKPNILLVTNIIKILFSSILMLITLILINNYVINIESYNLNKINLLILLVVSGFVVYILLSKILGVLGVINLNELLRKK